jgi:hypothetical protein
MMPNTTSEDRIRLVTRGDDAGMCPTVNRAIRDACRDGILRNVSVMVPAPAFEEAAAMLRGLEGISVGLHLDLTAEWAHLRWGPVLPPDAVPALVDADGAFFHTGQELLAHIQGAEPGRALSQMQAEVRAQLAKARAHGLEIAYLDEHMGIGWVGGLGEWLPDFCAEEGLICNRSLLETGALRRLPPVEGDVDDPVAALIAALKIAAPGTYLVVGHPVYPTEEMQQAHMPGQAPGIEAVRRDGQRRMLMASEIVAYCREHAVNVIRYEDV